MNTREQSPSYKIVNKESLSLRKKQPQIHVKSRVASFDPDYVLQWNPSQI